jgi:hypothetical protein
MSGAIASGSLRGAVNGAFSGALFFGVGEFTGAASSMSKVLAHSAAGCISAATGGGHCKAGAMAAGFAEFAGPAVGDLGSIAANVTKSALLGGIGSSIGGGRFEDGAMTGSFGYLFNRLGHSGAEQAEQYREEHGITRSLGVHLPGTQAGDSAAQYWAGLHVATGNPLYAIAGTLASLWTPDTAVETAKTLLGSGGGSLGVQLGREITFGRNVRIAPVGNRTGHPLGELPHYHRRGIDAVSGNTVPGQGIGRHRPWEMKSTDKSFWSRF